MVLNVPAKDIANTDMHQFNDFLQQPGLGSFATSLDSHDHVFVHD